MDPNVRILVVEDHFATLDGLVAGLAREPGFEVVGGCANGDEGLALADKLRPDIIVLDVHLPGTLGPSTMIQEYLRIPDARIVIFLGRVAFSLCSVSSFYGGFRLPPQIGASQ